MRYLLLALLVACNPVNKVIKSPEKTQKVVDYYLQHHPVRSDTVVKVLPGEVVTRIDTVSITDVLRDSLYIDRYITKSITKYRTDTMVKTIRDNSFVMALQQTNATQAGQIIALKEEVKTIGKRADKLNNRLIALWIGIGLLVGLRILKALRLIA